MRMNGCENSRIRAGTMTDGAIEATRIAAIMIILATIVFGGHDTGRETRPDQCQQAETQECKDAGMAKVFHGAHSIIRLIGAFEANYISCDYLGL